jgi:hypothetical protein
MSELLETINILREKQELTDKFFDIIKNFLVLLKKNKNRYKYTDYCVMHINELIRHENISMYKCIVFILLTIYNEQVKFNYDSNDVTTQNFENEIIKKSIEVLKDKNILSHIIVKINNILSSKIDNETIIKYKKTFGNDIIINYENVKVIGNNNIKYVYENFNKIKQLLKFCKIENPEFTKWKEEFYDVEEYLFCMYYFTCVRV